MESHVLRCTIHPKEGAAIHKSSEIVGEGKDYLSCLSEKLASMKSDVNAALSEMVEKEKAAAASANKPSAAASQTTAVEDEEIEDDDS